MSIAAMIWGWLRAIPWQAWLGLGGAVALFFAVQAHTRAIADVRATALREGATAAINLVNDRQAEADRLAQVGIKVIETKQGEIARENSDALYQAHDAIDARARSISLRHNAKIAESQRARRSGALPAASAASGEPCPPATVDGLSWDVALPLMTQAAKDLAQLNALLDFEEAQQDLASKEAPLGNAETK